MNIMHQRRVRRVWAVIVASILAVASLSFAQPASAYDQDVGAVPYGRCSAPAAGDGPQSSKQCGW